MPAARISTFDDWVTLFHEWIKDVGVDYPEIVNYKFEAKFGPTRSNEIEFGAFRGRPKWEKVIQIPDQRIRDALQNLIIYQGDTEFASVEQQRYLFQTAPSEHDRQSLCRVVTEEMRHGWQMCHLLIHHFGYGGRIEAQKMLERRAFEQKRLLGAFNQPVDNWLDFFTYTDFVDRDGKFQLTMLSYSAFAPLAQSMIPMLREESFHLGTGQDGLKRVIKAGVVPIPIVQKYINKWVPVSYDLFGVDNSSSAHWFYVWGLKGRFDEPKAQQEADLGHLNEHNRYLYHLECRQLIEQLNKNIPAGQPKLYVPDLKFHRRIGEFAGQPYSVTGELLSPAEYEQHLQEVLPSPEDVRLVNDIQANEPKWIAPKQIPQVN
ncbi:MAG: phenylacetate-CoA oxygenase subunit PaaI [Acidobacteriia bacterium]|jgi:benzoyl-CoA 2,3-dioxygenase component B|nr:phenylacetate-CoA oxygenase subunit PaaI [Terriglobia bacterium]